MVLFLIQVGSILEVRSALHVMGRANTTGEGVQSACLYMRARQRQAKARRRRFTENLSRSRYFDRVPT